MKNIFTEGWELRCEAQFQSHNQDEIKAYICSPLRSNTSEGVMRNMLAAKAYMLYALEAMRIYAYAPHAFLPMFLNDERPNERQLALQFGLYALALSSFVYVCGSRITEGMKGEIVYAARLKKRIYTFNSAVYQETRKILIEEGEDTDLVSLDLFYSPLGSACPVTDFMQTQLGVQSSLKGVCNALPI